MKKQSFLEKLPNLVDVNYDDELLMNQFYIGSNIAATCEEDVRINYSFLDETVEIKGFTHRIGNIIIEQKFSNLQELEDYLIPFGYHISNVYE